MTTTTTMARCARCGTAIVLMASGNWSTGYPSHLATTCDGTHLHQPAPLPAAHPSR